MRNGLRSVLTILGISVGVGAFICVVAIGNAGSSKIEDQLQGLGDNFVWIEAGSRSRNGMRAGARGTRSLVLSDAQAIVEQVPLIKSMSPNVDGHIQVVHGGENWLTQFRGVSPEFTEIRRWPMRLGAFFTEADVDGAAPVCVLGQTVVDNLFGMEDPTGKTIRAQGLPCKVTGVLRPRRDSSATGQDQDDVVIMSCYHGARRGSPAHSGWMTFFARPCLATRRPRLTDPDHRFASRAPPPDRCRGRRFQRPQTGRPYSSATRHEPNHDDPIGKRRVSLIAGWRDWHHEHHAGDGHPADAGNWSPLGGGSY